MSSSPPQTGYRLEVSPGTARAVELIRAAFPLEAATRASLPALSEDEWGAAEDAARRHGLAALLWRAIERLGRDDVPEPVRARLQDTYRRNALAANLAYRELARHLASFEAAQIHVMVLKGAALAATLYPELATRPFGDLDLLVHRSDVVRAREVLRASGLGESEELAPGFRIEFLGEAAFFAPGPQRADVDLHWELVVPTYYQRRMPREWFWEHTERAALADGNACVLDPTAQLVHLGAHAGLHHQDFLRLIWLYDLALLVTRRGEDVDWHAADALARNTGLARPLRAVLDAMQAAWGVHLPVETEELFRPDRFALVERAVYAVTVSSHNDARTLSDILATPGVGAKLRYARRQLLPAPAYMREHYAIQRPFLLPAYYALRIAETVQKFARSVWATFIQGK